MKKHFNCPAEMTLSLIGGKWKAILIYNVRKGPKRFGELRRLSPGISQAVLTKELKELESNGIIRRSVIGRDPLSGVEYALTSKGQSLRPILNSLIRWGIDHRSEHAIGNFGMEIFQK